MGDIHHADSAQVGGGESDEFVFLEVDDDIVEGAVPDEDEFIDAGRCRDVGQQLPIGPVAFDTEVIVDYQPKEGGLHQYASIDSASIF